MLRYGMLVAMLLSGVATLSIRAEERHLPTDSLSRQAQRDVAFAEHVTAMVSSRRFIFRPIEMQSIELGTTRDTYAYNFFFSLDEQRAVVHLPFEMVSMVIYTEQFEAIAANYSSALVADSYYRILFTLEHASAEWAVEMVVPLTTGEVRMAIVTAEGTMRYIGSLEPM